MTVAVLIYKNSSSEVRLHGVQKRQSTHFLRRKGRILRLRGGSIALQLPQTLTLQCSPLSSMTPFMVMCMPIHPFTLTAGLPYNTIMQPIPPSASTPPIVYGPESYGSSATPRTPPLASAPISGVHTSIPGTPFVIPPIHSGHSYMPGTPPSTPISGSFSSMPEAPSFVGATINESYPGAGISACAGRPFAGGHTPQRRHFFGESSSCPVSGQSPGFGTPSGRSCPIRESYGSASRKSSVVHLDVAPIDPGAGDILFGSPMSGQTGSSSGELWWDPRGTSAFF